jgi:hypothetical protein
MWACVSLLLKYIKKIINSIISLLIKSTKQCLTVYSPHELPTPCKQVRRNGHVMHEVESSCGVQTISTFQPDRLSLV